MKPANFVCIILAVAGLSFGIGQSIGQDRAEAGVEAARVQKVKDTGTHGLLRILFGYQRIIAKAVGDVAAQAHDTCLNVKALAGSDPYGQLRCDPLGS